MRPHLRQRKTRHGAIHAPESVLNAVASLVSYNWKDEFRDFQGRTPEERNGHVFRDLVVLRRWLRRNDVLIQT